MLQEACASSMMCPCQAMITDCLCWFSSCECHFAMIFFFAKKRNCFFYPRGHVIIIFNLARLECSSIEGAFLKKTVHCAQATKGKTRDLINKTAKLQSESKTLDKRMEIAKAFIHVFKLSPEYSAALSGGNNEISMVWYYIIISSFS